MGQNATFRQLLADAYAANLIELVEVTCLVLNKRGKKEGMKWHGGIVDKQQTLTVHWCAVANSKLTFLQMP